MLSYCHSKHSGFSLVEVLVAMTILFTFLATMASAFSTSSMSTEKAESAAVSSLLLPLIEKHISVQLPKITEEQSIPLAYYEGATFSWQASIVKTANVKTVQGGTSKTHESRLFYVNVDIKYKGNNSSYSFSNASSNEK
jgi:Tfp pilus assembly protein PilV